MYHFDLFDDFLTFATVKLMMFLYGFCLFLCVFKVLVLEDLVLRELQI